MVEVLFEYMTLDNSWPVQVRYPDEICAHVSLGSPYGMRTMLCSVRWRVTEKRVGGVREVVLLVFVQGADKSCNLILFSCYQACGKSLVLVPAAPYSKRI